MSYVRKNIKEDSVKALKWAYMSACDAYLEQFCKQMEFDIAEALWYEYGSIAKVGEIYISMHNIMVAVEKNVSYCKFIQWCDYCAASGVEDLTTCKLDNWLKK